jgi:hypothetical protein
MEGTDVSVLIPQSSTEYVKTPVTCSVTLDTQTVEISIDSKATWLPAVWTGSPGTQRTARTADPVVFSTIGLHHVYVRVTDAPEVPVMSAGTIKVI